MDRGNQGRIAPTNHQIWMNNPEDWDMDDVPRLTVCCPQPQSNSLINYFASIPSSIFGFFLGEPALAQGGDTCGSCSVPEPITGLVLAAGLGGAALKRAKDKSKKS